MIMQDIKLLSTSDMLQELRDRFDAMIFLAYSSCVKGPKDDRMTYIFNGDPLFLKGMCEEMKDVIDGVYDDDEEK